MGCLEWWLSLVLRPIWSWVGGQMWWGVCLKLVASPNAVCAFRPVPVYYLIVINNMTVLWIFLCALHTPSQNNFMIHILPLEELGW